MKEIIDPVDTEDGLFHDGDPSTGAEGTIVYAKIMNALQGGVISNQQELASVLKEAGIPIDPTKQDQLLTAIKSILGSGTADKAKSADKLTTARKIAGHDFDGTADISISASDVGALPDTYTAPVTSVNTKAGAVVLAASDVGAVSKDGGDYNGTFRFGRVEILPNEQNATVLFSNGGPAGTIVSGVEFNWYSNKVVVGLNRDGSDGLNGIVITLNGGDLQVIDAAGNTKFTGNVISGGSIMGLQGDERKHFSILNADGSARAYIYKDKGGDGVHITNGVDGGGEFIFGNNGQFTAPGDIAAGSTLLKNNGDIYGTVWGGWLSTQLLGRVTSSRRGPQQYINPGENGIWNGFEVPNGYFSGTRNHTDDGNAKFNEYYYRIQQIYIPAQGWVDTGTA